MQQLLPTVVLALCCSGALGFFVYLPKRIPVGHGWGPLIVPTRGEVWPKPRSVVNFHNHGYMVLKVNDFKFNMTKYKCDILNEAVIRYYKYLKLDSDAGFIAMARHRENSNELPLGRMHVSKKANYRGDLDELEIELMAPCEDLPYFGMDEHYELRVDSEDMPHRAKLISHSVWGVLRGLETFSQLVSPSLDGIALHINSSMISDYPRFPYRGLMIDTGRHFLPMATIYSLIDGMEANKLNVLHWHIVDDQSFPYQSRVYPELSEKGAYHPLSHVYSQKDVKAVIEYSRLRGIRVVPEFDTPGHTRSWGQAHPEILTSCYDVSTEEPDGTLGPLDPTKDATFEFVFNFIREISEVFPDNFLHIGGDEVDVNCWKSNPDINKAMQQMGIAGNYRKLEGIYINKVLEKIYSLNMSAVVWQEVFDNKAGKLKNSTIVHIWKGYHYQADLKNVTAAGHLALLSAPWYLDNLSKSWIDFYIVDPQNFDGTPEQIRLVQGGEACMWGEYVDVTNVVSRVFPRASAVAERLWSGENVMNEDEAARRLEEFRCRMNRRGISAAPASGPGYCPGEVFATKEEL